MKNTKSLFAKVKLYILNVYAKKQKNRHGMAKFIL